MKDTIKHYIISTILLIVFIIITLNIACGQQQTCEADVFKKENWSELNFGCTKPPVQNDSVYVTDVLINDLGNNDVLTIDSTIYIVGTLSFNVKGTNPTLIIPEGVTLYVSDNLNFTDNNVNLIVNGLLIVDDTLKMKNNNMVSGKGVITGGVVEVLNNTVCDVNNPPTILFSSCCESSSCYYPPSTNVSGFCSKNNPQGLPINFSYFTAEYVGGLRFNLLWGTVQEIENDKFILEHSKDLIKWERLDSVEGVGYSNSIKHYYKDVFVRNLLKTHYFRLMQVDLNGTYTFSKTEMVKLFGSSGVKLYPNYVNKNDLGNVRFKLYTQKQLKKTEVKVYNSSGVLIKNIVRGEGGLNFGKLKQGLYIVLINNRYRCKLIVY